MPAPRKPRKMLNIPAYLETPKSRYDVAANLAHILMANGQSIFGRVRGNISAKDQRAVFGVYLGKGEMILDGSNDSVAATYQTAFGGDSERAAWLECQTGTVGRNFASISGVTKRELEIDATKEWF